MKTKILIIAYLFAFMIISGCAIQRNPKREYYSINEIKAFYGLTNAQCDSIAKSDSIESIYHCEKGRMYKYEIK